MKISRKIFAITFLISSIAIVGILTLTLARTYATLHDLAQQNLQESTSRETRIIAALFETVKSDLQMLAEQASRDMNLRTDIGRNEIAESMSILLRRRPAYLGFSLKIPDRMRPLDVYQPDYGIYETKYVLQNLPMQESLTHETTDLWPGRVHFSSVIELDTPNPYRSKLRVIYATIHVATENKHSPDGILTLALDFDALITGFGRPRNDVSFFLSDGDGHYLYRPSFLQDEKNSANEHNIAKEFHVEDQWQHWRRANDPQLYFGDPERKLSVVIERVMLSDPMMGSAARILTVGGIASFSNIEEKIRIYRIQLILIALGVGALVALALAFATLRLTQPIYELTQVADRIAAGERNISSTAVERDDELGLLARAIMHMLNALRDSAKNEEQAALGRMATMVAHDVRNALSSVKINLQMLYAHHAREGQDFTEGCRIALDQISYMECILNDMLDFAHPRTLIMDWVDLDEVIKVATLSMLPEISEKSIGFHLSEERLPKVFGDRTRLIQIFQNLLSNAIQSMNDNGHLSIGIHYILYQSCPAVDITITDDGSGIPDAILGRVFEPFFTTRAKGTGLGLTIVRRIAINHGGDISLEANPKGGTIAHVILPLSPIAADITPDTQA